MNNDMTAHLKPKLFLLLLLSMLASALSAGSFTIKPYSTTYQAQYDFLLPFKGTATRELSKSESGEWVLAHHIKSPMIKLIETSRFNWQNNRPTPLSYQYSQSTLTNKKKVLLEFDWAKMEATNKALDEPVIIALQTNTLDKINYQLQLRKDLIEKGSMDTYSVADRKRIKEYQFETLGEELLQTAVGTLRTLKIRRARKPDAKRQTTIWLAKDWDYLVVQIQQIENSKSYTIQLAEGTLDGVTISGLKQPDSSENASTPQ